MPPLDVRVRSSKKLLQSNPSAEHAICRDFRPFKNAGKPEVNWPDGLS